MGFTQAENCKVWVGRERKVSKEWKLPYSVIKSGKLPCNVIISSKNIPAVTNSLNKQIIYAIKK